MTTWLQDLAHAKGEYMWIIPSNRYTVRSVLVDRDETKILVLGCQSNKPICFSFLKFKNAKYIKIYDKLY